MMRTDLEFEGSPVDMSADEIIPWGFDPADVLLAGEVVANPTVKAYKLSDGSDVSGTVLNGAASVVDDIIYQTVKSLTKGEKYRVEVKFTPAAGKTLEGYLIIRCVI